LNTDVQSLNKDGKEWKKHCRILEKQLTDKDRQINNLRNQMTELQSQVKNLSSQSMNDSQNSFKKPYDQVSILQHELTLSNTHLREIQLQLNEMKNRHALELNAVIEEKIHEKIRRVALKKEVKLATELKLKAEYEFRVQKSNANRLKEEKEGLEDQIFEELKVQKGLREEMRNAEKKISECVNTINQLTDFIVELRNRQEQFEKQHTPVMKHVSLISLHKTKAVNPISFWGVQTQENKELNKTSNPKPTEQTQTQNLKIGGSCGLRRCCIQ